MEYITITLLPLLVKIVIGLAAFTVLVVVHEWGHFILARLSGIGVEEFAIGMGPKLYYRKGKRTDFSVRALPIGGFCRMRGEEENSTEPDAFNNRPIKGRFATILAGAIMNLILAILLFSFVYSTTNEIFINGVVPGLAAAKGGIVAGDQILEVGGKTLKDYTVLNLALQESAGKPVVIKVKSGTKIVEKTVVPVYDAVQKKALIGVQLRPGIAFAGVSVVKGFSRTVDASKMMFDFLGRLVSGRASSDEVSGPVGIVTYYGQAIDMGIGFVLNLTAFLSLNLAIINILPFPALDGGRLLFLLIEGVRGKPVPREQEGIVHFIGFGLLMALMVFIMYKDILKLITGKM